MQNRKYYQQIKQWGQLNETWHQQNIRHYFLFWDSLQYFYFSRNILGVDNAIKRCRSLSRNQVVWKKNGVILHVDIFWGESKGKEVTKVVLLHIFQLLWSELEKSIEYFIKENEFERILRFIHCLRKKLRLWNMQPELCSGKVITKVKRLFSLELHNLFLAVQLKI